MVVCKFCGENIPQLALFKHFNMQHPEEMKRIHQKGKNKATTNQRAESCRRIPRMTGITIIFWEV